MEWLDKICEDTYFIKIGTGEYKLQDDENPIGALLVLISRFKKQSWLIQNLKTWKTFDDEGRRTGCFKRQFWRTKNAINQKRKERSDRMDNNYIFHVQHIQMRAMHQMKQMKTM